MTIVRVVEEEEEDDDDEEAADTRVICRMQERPMDLSDQRWC